MGINYVNASVFPLLRLSNLESGGEALFGALPLGSTFDSSVHKHKEKWRTPPRPWKCCLWKDNFFI